MSPDGDGRERADDEVDAAWADIIARLGPLEEPGPEPPPDHASAEPSPAPPPPARGAGPRDHVVDDPGHPGGPGSRDARDARDDGDDHYVPEDPAPLRGAGLAWWAPWLALVGAPVLLAVVGLARGSVPAWLVLAAVAAFTAGAVAAVMRLPSSRTDDGRGGDGAVL